MQTGAATYEERVEFHRRLALPFACLVFTLAGLPLGVSTTRGSKSMGLVLSLILMLVYYLAFIGGTRIAGNAQFSPFLGAWLPNLFFAALGIVLIGRSDREHENPLLSRLAAVIQWFSDRRSEMRTSRQRFSFERGRVSIISTVSPSPQVFSSSCALNLVVRFMNLP